MGNPDRFAPDADTPEAKTSESRITLPAPQPAQSPLESDGEAPSGVRPMDVAHVAELELLGPLSQIPRLALHLDALLDMKLDAPSGFLLSLVDGRTSLEQILDMCAMPQIQAVRLLGALRFLGIIELEEPRP